MAKLRIVLADDHPLLCEGLAALINAQDDMHVVAQAHEGTTALHEVQHWLPDVLVTDLSMPGVGGIALTEQVRRAVPLLAVVILSRHSETGYVRQALQAGASGYVLKQSVALALIEAIRTVVRGNTYIDPVLNAQLAHDFVAQVAQGNATEQGLSERETGVVRLLAHGYSNKEIANQLGISVKTVDTYKTRAMDKLGLYGRAALVRYAMQMGWFESDS